MVLRERKGLRAIEGVWGSKTKWKTAAHGRTWYFVGCLQIIKVLETAWRRWDEHAARVKGNEKYLQNFIRGNLRRRERSERLRHLVIVRFCEAKWLYEQGNVLLLSITDMDFFE